MQSGVVESYPAPFLKGAEGGRRGAVGKRDAVQIFVVFDQRVADTASFRPGFDNQIGTAISFVFPAANTEKIEENRIMTDDFTVGRFQIPDQRPFICVFERIFKHLPVEPVLGNHLRHGRISGPVKGKQLLACFRGILIFFKNRRQDQASRDFCRIVTRTLITTNEIIPQSNRRGSSEKSRPDIHKTTLRISNIKAIILMIVLFNPRLPSKKILPFIKE